MELSKKLIGRTITKIEMSRSELEITLDNNTKLVVTSQDDINCMSILDIRVYTQPKPKIEDVYIEFGQGPRFIEPPQHEVPVIN